MSTVDVEELHQETAAVLRRVRDGSEAIAISENGEIVARLIPEPERPTGSDSALADQVRRAHDRAILADMDRLAAEIGKDWPEGVSAVDAVRDGRREL